MKHLGQFDVDARVSDGGRRGLVEGLRHAGERRQHRRGVVGEVGQLALVEGIGTGTESQVIQLNVAAAPRELNRRELGADGLVEIDRHALRPGQVQRRKVAERHGRPDGPAGAGIGVAHHGCADIACGIEAVDEPDRQQDTPSPKTR